MAFRFRWSVPVVLSFILVLFSTLAFSAKYASKLVRAFYIDDMYVLALYDSKAGLTPDLYGGAPKSTLETLGKQTKRAATVNAFVLKRDDQTILIDAGYGTLRTEAENGQILKALKGASIAPEEITAILLTHLHPDHVGGLITENKATFPNATVYVSQKELDYWNDNRSITDPNQASTFETARRFQTFYKIQAVKPDDVLFSAIKVIDEAGHTPGHVGYLVESGNGKLLFWGDIIHNVDMQTANPNIYLSFDVNPTQAVETRKKILAWVAEENIVVAGAHISFPGLITIRKGKAPNTYRYQYYRTPVATKGC